MPLPRRLLTPPSVARGLDPRNGAHLLLAALTVLTSVSLFARSQSWGDAITSAVAVFLAWAIGRELDPDRMWTAHAAAATMGLLALVYEGAHVDLMGNTVALLAARVVLASTGRPFTIWDVPLVAGAAWLASDSRAGLATTLVLIAGVGLHLVRTARTQDRPVESTAVGAAVAVAAAGSAGAAAVLGWPLAGVADSPRWILLAGVTLGAAAVLVAVRELPRSACDSAHGRFSSPPPLSAWRLSGARITAVLVIVAAFTAVGPGAFSALTPTWVGACCAGTAVAAQIARCRPSVTTRR